MKIDEQYEEGERGHGVGKRNKEEKDLRGGKKRSTRKMKEEGSEGGSK